MTDPHGASPTDAILAQLHREERSRLLATLVRRFGDLDLAEDTAQEAMEAALVTWPRTGIPDNPLAWLTTTARNRALDRVRRDGVYARRIAELHLEQGDRTAPAAEEQVLDADSLPDDRLAMLLGCCHPAIAPADRIALMLRFVGGLTSAEVAQALLLPLSTVQARLTRAKKRIAATRIPLTVPDSEEEIARRVPLVHTAISLVFTEGYAASTGEDSQRVDLADEAVRLARILTRLLPRSAESTGLLALLLLSRARSEARRDEDGLPVPLEDQDRSLWDRDLLDEGIHLAERAAAMPGAGACTIQACIAAVHAEAPCFEDTDWAQIVALYDMLAARDTSPVVQMSRAVAVGRRDGPAAGLALLDELADDASLARHHPFHVARAITLEELGREEEARVAFATAITLCDNASERRYLLRRRG